MCVCAYAHIYIYITQHGDTDVLCKCIYTYICIYIYMYKSLCVKSSDSAGQKMLLETFRPGDSKTSGFTLALLAKACFPLLRTPLAQTCQKSIWNTHLRGIALLTAKIQHALPSLLWLVEKTDGNIFLVPPMQLDTPLGVRSVDGASTPVNRFLSGRSRVGRSLFHT